MAYVTDGTLGIDLTATSTTKTFNLGDEKPGSDGNIYKYIKASAAIAAYELCLLIEDGTAVGATTTTAGAIPSEGVVPQVAFAINEYGWAVSRGISFSVLGAASCVLNVKLYTTATAGVVDDAVTTLVEGLRLNETLTGAAAANASAAQGIVINGQS